MFVLPFVTDRGFEDYSYSRKESGDRTGWRLEGKNLHPSVSSAITIVRWLRPARQRLKYLLIKYLGGRPGLKGAGWYNGVVLEAFASAEEWFVACGKKQKAPSNFH
jgi:hypothetical protein